jgi:hypothetical protein
MLEPRDLSRKLARVLAAARWPWMALTALGVYIGWWAWTVAAFMLSSFTVMFHAIDNRTPAKDSPADD